MGLKWVNSFAGMDVWQWRKYPSALYSRVDLKSFDTHACIYFFINVVNKSTIKLQTMTVMMNCTKERK